MHKIYAFPPTSINVDIIGFIGLLPQTLIMLTYVRICRINTVISTSIGANSKRIRAEEERRVKAVAYSFRVYRIHNGMGGSERNPPGAVAGIAGRRVYEKLR